MFSLEGALKTSLDLLHCSHTCNKIINHHTLYGRHQGSMKTEISIFRPNPPADSTSYKLTAMFLVHRRGKHKVMPVLTTQISAHKTYLLESVWLFFEADVRSQQGSTRSGAILLHGPGHNGRIKWCGAWKTRAWEGERFLHSDWPFKQRGGPWGRVGWSKKVTEYSFSQLVGNCINA